MDKKVSNKEVINNVHLEKIENLAKKILKFKQSDRYLYFKTISNQDIKLISEIILNFLKNNLEVDFESFNLLKRVKKELYTLSSKKISYKNKRALLFSIKGLHIINLVLPLFLDTVNK